MRDDLTAVQAEVFGSVFVLAQHLGRRADEGLVPFGVTTRQWLLLAVIDEWFHDRSPSLTEAALRYGSSRQNVKQIALQLEARGYLRLEPDPEDARTTRLVLTEAAGVFDEPEVRRRQAAFLDDVFGGLSPADQRRLHALVRRWLTQVTPQTAAPGAPRPERGGTT